MKAKTETNLSTWRSGLEMLKTWRLLSVGLFSFSSGLPLGLVWYSIPTWLTEAGVNIGTVGLITLSQAPWTFKFLWAPLMDRHPLPILGRRRGWILAGQVGLFGLGLWLAGVSAHPEAVGVIGSLALATALASATQDIAIDGYAVEVLRREEFGTAAGARTGFYRLALQISGGIAITVAADLSWTLVNFVLALLYLPTMLVTRYAPEPEGLAAPPPTLRQAVWEPFKGLMAQHRAIEILAFVVLYKLSDNLTQNLTRPFFIQLGAASFDYGFGTQTVGQIAAILGAMVGAVLTDKIGLGRALWIFGVLQIVSNLGYAVLAETGPNRTILYASHAFEHITTGLGTGAFSVLLLRLTAKRFSATQYALLSSLFTIPRVFTGPAIGVYVSAIGWRDFFILTVFTGIPGLLMLARFVPWRIRDVEFTVAPAGPSRPIRRLAVALWGMLAGVSASILGFLLLAAPEAYRLHRGGTGVSEAFLAALRFMVLPPDIGGWIRAGSVWLLALMVGVAAAATLVARRGVVPRNEPAAAGVES